MDNNQPQVQAVRAVNKGSLDSATLTPGPIVHFDCHSNPATGKSFLLWDDIRLVFTDALYVRHETKIIPFMKDAEWMPLKPLRIAAIPDVVLDIVVDGPLVSLDAAMQQTTLSDTPMEATVQDTFQEDIILSPTTSSVSNAPRRNPVYGLEEIAMDNYSHIDRPDFPGKPRSPQFVPPNASRRNPVYGLVETAMDNYSHIDHPEFQPKSKAPQFVPTAEQEVDALTINSEPVNDNAQSTNNMPASTSQSHQSPQDRTAIAVVRDISPIIVKASLGDPISQVELGDMYRTGDGVAQDFEEARYWYLKAANQGDPTGQCNLGHLYRLELGVERNHSTALSWYKKAAYQGDAGGQCYVGLVHDYGLVGAVDYSAAMDLYTMAANQGYSFAQYSIGELYVMGHGVEQDYDKAMEWYRLAADQGHPAAQTRIGRMYGGGMGVSEDEAVAVQWLNKAAIRKDVDVWAQFAMGFVYFFGIGVPKSYSTAFPWFLKAARQGSPSAQSIVGRMYRDGLGIPQNDSAALVWFLKSANHNTPYSQYVIGTMYLQGRGVPKNYSTAQEWFVKAAKFGYEAANASLSEVQQFIDEDEESAKASEKKSTSARLKFW